MKIKNSFFIPFIFFNCGQNSNSQSENDAKIKKVEEKIKKKFTQYENYERIQDLKFGDEVYSLSTSLQKNDTWLDSFVLFVRENEVYFRFLCPYDFSNQEEEKAAEAELKSSVKRFIELQEQEDSDKSEIAVLLGKICFLFQNLSIKDFKEFFGEGEKHEKIITNLLNFAVSVYCKNTLERSFFIEIANENARVCQREYEKYKLQHMGVSEQIKTAKIESDTLKDPKIQAVITLPENFYLTMLHGEKYDDQKFVYCKDLTDKWIEGLGSGNPLPQRDEVLRQIANLAVGSKHYARSNFLANELIRVIQFLSGGIDNQTLCGEINILQACCDIFRESAQRGEKLGLSSFRIFIRHIKKGSIKSSEQWKDIVEMFDRTTNEIGDENDRHFLFEIFTGQVLNSTELVNKTLDLIGDHSLSCRELTGLLGVIEDPEKNFSSKENFQELFKKFNCSDLCHQSSSSINDANTALNRMIIDEFFKYYHAPQIFLDHDTFIKMLNALREDEEDAKWEDSKKKFSFDTKNMNAVFIYECSDAEKQKVIQELKNAGIEL